MDTTYPRPKTKKSAAYGGFRPIADYGLLADCNSPALVDRPGSFVAHAPGFAGVVGEEPRLSLLAEVDAHEGPVYLADEDALQALFRRIKDDFDPTLAEVREKWEAAGALV